MQVMTKFKLRPKDLGTMCITRKKYLGGTDKKAAEK